MVILPTKYAMSDMARIENFILLGGDPAADDGNIDGCQAQRMYMACGKISVICIGTK